MSPEDLILSRLEWAKDSRFEVQLSDVRNLLKDVKGLNRRYRTRWAKHWASKRCTMRCAGERYARWNRAEVPDAAATLGREAFEDGVFDALDRPGLGQSLHLRKGPDCSEARVVLRFYGDEFQPKSKKILRALRTAADVIRYDTG
jgi:hypothetical protein